MINMHFALFTHNNYTTECIRQYYSVVIQVKCRKTIAQRSMRRPALGVNDTTTVPVSIEMHTISLTTDK